MVENAFLGWQGELGSWGGSSVIEAKEWNQNPKPMTHFHAVTAVNRAMIIPACRNECLK